MKKYNLIIFHQSLPISVMQVGNEYHSRRNAYTATEQDGQLVATFSRRLRKASPAPVDEPDPAAMDYPEESEDVAVDAPVLSWQERFKRMKKHYGWTYARIAEITGNTPGSMRVVINRDFPAWAKLAVVQYEIENGHRDHAVVV